MSRKTLSNEIIWEFRRYCSRCKGLCCSKEINAFTFEIKKWPKIKLDIKRNWQKGKSPGKSPICRFNIGKNCPFLLNKSCRMSPVIRPIDCISYPVYPIIENTRNESRIDELMIHKSCPYAKEIAKNKKISKLLLEFWRENNKKISKGDIKIWLGDKRNYWLDKNIIKIKNVQCADKY